MSRYLIGAIAFAIASSFVPVRAQTTIPAGIIDTDTHWPESGNPYILQGNILVVPGTTLTIAPGVEVHFQHSDLVVGGRIVARGTVSNGIAFRDDLDLGKMHFSSYASEGSILSHCSFDRVPLHAERNFPLVEFCSFGQSAGIVKLPPLRSPNVIIRDCSFPVHHDLVFNVVETVVFERNIGGRRLDLVDVSDIRVQDNTIVTPIGIDPFILQAPPASVGGVISGNLFSGAEVLINGFIGDVTQNVFSIDRLRLDGTGGTWTRNTFTFNYSGDEGVEINTVAGFMTFNDNSFSPFPDLANSESIFLVKSGLGGVIDAESNWWSTSDKATIEEAIDHFIDNGNAPFVDFVPFRTSSIEFCTIDVDCADDGVFCNGPELCVDGLCVSNGNPCQPPGLCNEDDDACDPCLDDLDCDNGIFCDGPESCDAENECQVGTPPCTGSVCDEESGECVECLEDLDDDGVCDDRDNCPTVANPSQSDGDNNGVGDACEPCIDNIDCDDRNDCTIDNCGVAGLCEQTDSNDGVSCEDGFFCTINDSCVSGVCVTGTVNPTCVGPPGEDGLDGQPGPQGPSGPSGAPGSQGPSGSQGQTGSDGSQGPAGISCWDLDGDGIGDTEEDVNEDGDFNAMDCVGEPGPPGAQGTAGPAGVSCWDLNGDGVGDPDEDVNGDGDFDALDCRGIGGRPCEDDSDCQDGLFCNGIELCIGNTCTPGSLPCDLETETCREDGDQCIPSENPPGQAVPGEGDEPSPTMCGSMATLTMLFMFIGLAAMRKVGRTKNDLRRVR